MKNKKLQLYVIEVKATITQTKLNELMIELSKTAEKICDTTKEIRHYVVCKNA